MKIKYVVYDGFFPILFTEAHQHSDVSVGRKATSAGFCSITACEMPPTAIKVFGVKVSVYGESSSLKLKSRPEDACLIDRMLNDE